MGKSHSKLEQAKKELDALEASMSSGGSSQPLKEKLHVAARAARLQGELTSASDFLQKLLVLYEQEGDRLNAAKTMVALSTVMRLELEPVPSSPQLGETDIMSKYGKAEDLIIRALEIYKSYDTEEARLLTGKAHAMLAVLQQSYGRTDEAQKSCEKALVAYSEFPLTCDHEKWVFKNGDWVSPQQPQHTASSSILIPYRNNTRQSQDSNRSSLPGNPPSDNILAASSEPPTPLPAPPPPKIEWRLVPYSVLQRRPSALQRFRSKGQRGSINESFPIVPLVPPHMEVGAPPVRPKIKPDAFYVKIKDNEIIERHAVFDLVTEDGETVWTVTDPKAPRGRGIRVNGVRISQSVLHEGDLVQLGLFFPFFTTCFSLWKRAYAKKVGTNQKKRRWRIKSKNGRHEQIARRRYLLVRTCRVE